MILDDSAVESEFKSFSAILTDPAIDHLTVSPAIALVTIQDNDSELYINTLRCLLSVCPCVCDRCGHGRNEFAGRVQNHHMGFSFGTENIFLGPFLEILKAVAGLDTLRCRLHEGCHCERLPSH